MSAQIKADRFPVVLFTNSFIMGGMEEHLLLLGRELVRRAFSVAAICSPAAEIEPLRAGLAAAGVDVFAPEHRPASRAGFPRRLRALVETFKRYPGCVLHIHSTGFHNGDLPMLAARLAGARSIVRTEHVPPQPPITASSKLRVRLRDRFVDRVICVSEQNRVEHIGQLGRDAEKFQVVLNGCDLRRFTPEVDGRGVREELGIDRPDARFVIAGDGPLRPELEHRARDLGVAGSVVFAGERQDIPRLVAAMNVFVMPSLYEGCQYTLMEAMAMAKPIVSTPAGVAPDVIHDGVTGRLVPFADGQALARGVLDLLDDGDLAVRLGRTAREVALERFSVDGMVDNLVEVYRAA